MGIVPGWSDRDVFVLLELFRAHLWDYIYCSVEDFAEIVHTALPDISKHDVIEAVRLVMKQFALAFDTHKFRGRSLVVDGNEVFVNEYLHETIKMLRENRSGGVYLPDELIRFLQKAKMYKKHLYDSPRVFFSRIQLWGKSIAESQAKFYALREMYHKEKQEDDQEASDAVNAIRFQVLAGIFDDVPHPPAISQAPTPTSKLTSKLWSPGDLEVLVDLLVRITHEMQQNGTSTLVQIVTSKLRRTEGSCVNKLQDIRDRFLKKSTTLRAANLPDVMYDPTSDANKIFNADWTDPQDPYALGFFAMKNYFNRMAKRRKSAPVSSVRTTRAMVRRSSSAASKSQQSAASTRGDQGYPSSRQRRGLNVTEQVAASYGWTEEYTSAVLASMKRNLPLYREKKRRSFFVAISDSMSGSDIDDVFVNGSQILHLFETRFGGLEKLEAMSFGHKDDNAGAEIPGSVGAEKDSDAQIVGSAPSVRSSVRGSRLIGSDASSRPRVSVGDAMHDYAVSLDDLDDTGFAPGSEIGWDDDSPDRLSAGDEDASEDQFSGSPEHTRHFLDSPVHTSSTSSYTSDSRRSDASSRKRSQPLSYIGTSLCMSCHKRLRDAPRSGKSTTPNASFGKQTPSTAGSAGLVGYGKDGDNADEVESVNASEDDLDNVVDTSDNDESPVDDAAAVKLTSKLQTLICAEDARIKELEARNIKLIERKAERERLAAKAQATERLRSKVTTSVTASLRV